LWRIGFPSKVKGDVAMSKRVKSLMLILVLMLMGSTAIGQGSFKDMVEQQGLEWLIGRWKGAMDDGQEIVLTYQWAAQGNTIVSTFKMGESSSQGMIYLDMDAEQAKQFSVDSQGRVNKGTWEVQGDKAVLKTTMYDEYGDATELGVTFAEVNDSTIKVAVYPLENGELAWDPWFETNYKRMSDSDSVALFNGKNLAGWKYYLVEPDVKMADVWSVRDGLLICKGEPMGYIATKKKYTNFKLVVEWRWAPGKKAGNSGVLMRITGQPRALPKCTEAQLQSGKAGDIYGFHGFKVKGDAARSRTAENEMIGKLSGVSKIKGNEKTPGQWNKYEITLKGGNLTLLINGEKVNEAYGLDIVAGNIGLQSEGGEIHFRTVELTPLD